MGACTSFNPRNAWFAATWMPSNSMNAAAMVMNFTTRPITRIFSGSSVWRYRPATAIGAASTNAAAKHIINAQINTVRNAARRTPSSSPAPACSPTRTAPAMDMPSGPMKAKAATFNATWKAAISLTPIRPINNTHALNKKPSNAVVTPIGQPRRNTSLPTRQSGLKISLKTANALGFSWSRQYRAKTKKPVMFAADDAIPAPTNPSCGKPRLP